jgi:DNA invertase Pin-like site-specific DNA recombinase
MIKKPTTTIKTRSRVKEVSETTPTIEEQIREVASGSPRARIKLRAIVSVRESSKRSVSGAEDLDEYTKMLSSVVTRDDVKDFPGADTILSLGSLLVRMNAEGEAARQALNAVTYYDPTSPKSVLSHFIIIGDVGYLLSVFSAAKPTHITRDGIVDVTNAFTDLVATLVQQYSPDTLHIGPFARLVRNRDVAQSMKNTLKSNHTTVYYSGGEPIDLDSQSGDLNWEIQSIVASGEWNSITNRLMGGAHAMLEEGHWPKAESQLPGVGYKFRDPNTPEVVPNLDELELVQDIVAWAKNRENSWEKIAKLIGEKHGWASPILRIRSKNDNLTIADSSEPGQAVRRLLTKALPIWLSGFYRYEQEVPNLLVDPKKRNLRTRTKDNTLVESREIVTSTGELATITTSRVQFPLDFHHEELPGGEWVPEGDLIEVMKRLVEDIPSATFKEKFISEFIDEHRAEEILKGVRPRRTGPTGGSSKKTERKPLSGIGEWVSGDTQYVLSARDEDNYIIYSRPATEAVDARTGRRRGWKDKHSDAVAFLPASETHQAISAAIIEHLDTLGVDWSRSAVRNTGATKLAEADADRLSSLNEEAQALVKKIEKLERLLDLAIEDDLTETIRERQREIEKTRRTHRALLDRIAAGENARGNRRLLSANSTADVRTIVSALAALAKTETQAPSTLGDTLQGIIKSLSATVSEDGLNVNLELNIGLETSDGAITVGPINATVSNTIAVRTRNGRAEAILTRYFRDGLTFEEAAKVCGYNDLLAAKRRLHESLMETGVISSKGLRSAAIDTPITDIRRVLWAEIEARKNEKPFTVPQGIDPAWAAHIRDIYTSDLPWLPAWCTDSHEASRNAIAAVKAGGEDGLLWDTLIFDIAPHAEKRSVATLSEELVRGKGAGNGSDRNFYEPILERVGAWHGHNPNRRVKVRSCPYCGTRTLDHVLRVPEVKGGLLCSTCRRTPTMPTVVFPVEYLEDHAGNRGWGKGREATIRPGRIEPIRKKRPTYGNDRLVEARKARSKKAGKK